MFFNKITANSTTPLQSLPQSKKGKIYADVPLNYFNNVEELKNYVTLLYENPDHNRQELLSDFGIESYGYKRLRKELDNWRVK